MSIWPEILFIGAAMATGLLAGWRWSAERKIARIRILEQTLLIIAEDYSIDVHSAHAEAKDIYDK